MIEKLSEALTRRGFIVQVVPGNIEHTIDGEPSQATNVCGYRRGLWVCVAVVDDDRVCEAWSLADDVGNLAHRRWPDDFDLNAFIDDVEEHLLKKLAEADRLASAIRRVL